MEKEVRNYRGIRPASIIEVGEGKGTQDSPYETVYYVVVMEEVNGFVRPITLGKVTPIKL